MEKKGAKKAAKEPEKKLIKLSDDSELTASGDKFYDIDSEQLIFEVLKDFNHGTIELDDVIIKREYIESFKDGINISHTEIKHKTDPPKATIAIVHGLGQNSDLFIEYGIQFAMNGYKVQAIDLRGFGWSGGLKAQYTITEIQIALLKEADAEIPLFLYAHSMGCMILCSFLMNNPKLNVAGVVLSGPLCGNPPNVTFNAAKLFFISLIGEHVPELFINPKVNVTEITKKVSIMKWYLSSHLVVPIIGVRQAANLMKYFKHYKYNAKSFQFPVLIHTGSEDKVICNKEAKKFYDLLGSQEKQIFEYEGCRHELQFEDCSRELLKNTFDWINLRLKEVNTKNLGAIDFDTIKIEFLKKRAPFRHYKALATFLVILYYFIGYVLMVTKFINKNKHEMIAFWPCSLYRKFFLKK